MAKVDYKELKNNGFIPQVQKDRFSMRIKVFGGKMQSEHLKKVYEISEKYGEGYVHMTSRQSIEIPFIKLEDVEAVRTELKEAGMEPAACGPAVRTITACQGCTVCKSGLIDTTELAGEIDEKYYAKPLPHKFKIGITGCRNNCLKAEENDIGIKGGMKPQWSEDKCTFCGLCQNVCRAKAITVEKQEKKLTFDESKCEMCGRCVKICPTKAWTGESGFVVYVGGLFGNRIQIGKQLIPIVFTKEQLFKVVEAAMEFFNKHGKPKERFGDTLKRVGWKKLEKVLKEVLNNSSVL
ncbi:MAG: 4Fe-4S binding protein [Clostridia bacterium]|nr:4Fe-4S binding protein [Clostridia bacterium]